MKRQIKRTIALLLVICFLASFTATSVSAKMIFKPYAVGGSYDGRIGYDGRPGGGSAAGAFAIPGFKYPGTVYLVLTDWHIKYTGGHHSVEEIAILSQRATTIPGQFEWATEFPVHKDGYIRGQYVGKLNDDNDDNPFEFTVWFLAMQDT